MAEQGEDKVERFFYELLELNDGNLVFLTKNCRLDFQLFSRETHCYGKNLSEKKTSFWYKRAVEPTLNARCKSI